MKKIEQSWKLMAGLVSGLCVNGVVAKVISGALDGKKLSVTDVIGGGLISGLAGGLVGNEIMKTIDVINEKFGDADPEEVVDDITTDE